MSGMAGNVSAFATVWTYDIYRPFIKKDAADAHYVTMGRWCTILGVLRQHRHGLPGDAVREHHGLRPGAVQLLHRAAVRHGAPGHALEAGHAGGRLLGPAGGHGLLDRHVGLGQARPGGAALSSRSRPTPRTWPRTCTAALWSWIVCVVVTVVVSLVTQPKTEQRAGRAGLRLHARSLPSSTCRSGSGRSSGRASSGPCSSRSTSSSGEDRLT